MKLSGADILWSCLVEQGVDTVFGYPGGAIQPAYDRLLDHPIRHMLVRHEQSAAHMADGYARASGASAWPWQRRGPAPRISSPASKRSCLHHGPGARHAARVGCVPGDRYHRHHAAHHQAQLPGAARRGHRASRPRGVPRGHQRLRYAHTIDALDRVASVLRRQRVRADAFTAVAPPDGATAQATIMFESTDKTAARVVALLGRQVGVLAVEE
jgi:hypothetical protein